MIAIVKISAKDFHKYHVRNLLKFTAWLDVKFPGWKWYNVYDKKTKNQIGNFTNKQRPTAAKIEI